MTLQLSHAFLPAVRYVSHNRPSTTKSTTTWILPNESTNSNGMTNKYDNNQYTAVYLLQLLFRNQTIKEISMLSLETYRNRHLGMANESARQTACVCLQAHAGRLKQAEHGERIAPEITTKFDLTPVQGHPRSSILVSIESPFTTSYYSLIVTLAVSATVFEILTLEAKKIAEFFRPTLV